MTPAPKAESRLIELDALRGIAALLVLVHHALQLLPHLEHPAIPGVGHLRYILTTLTPLRVIETGRGAVLFFFVLSGYVLTLALLRGGSPGLLAFAAQRTLRLMLPVAASVLLSVGLWSVVADPALPEEWRLRSLYTWLEAPTLLQAASNSLLIGDSNAMRLNVVLWSLVHEWRLTVLLPLVLCFRGRAALFLAVVLGISWLGLLGGASENTVLLGLGPRGAVAATFYFAAGVGAGAALALWLGPEVPVLSRQASYAAGLACVVLFGMASDLATYAGSVLLILLARQPGQFRALLRCGPFPWIGSISFSLYLVHVPVLVATLHLLHEDWAPAAIAFIGSVAAILTAAAFLPLVEVPARRLARRAERLLAPPGWRPAPVPISAPAPPRDWAPEGGMAATPR